MNPRILPSCCIVTISLCIAPRPGMADEPVAAASRPAASTREVPLVWALVVTRKFDTSYMGYGVGHDNAAGAWAVHPLDSGKLGVFLAQAPVPDKDKQRLIFIDDKGARHVADCGGCSWTNSVCMTFYRTPKSCPLKSVREILIEQQVPETDPLVQRQKEDEQREARKPEIAKGSPLPSLITGKPYPFVLADTKGGRIDSKQLLGKVVILDFWATWCGPCVAEIPRLKGLYERHHSQGLEILSIDMGEDPQKVAAFVRDRQIPWLQAVLSAAEQEAVSAATGIEGIPHFLVLDRHGILRDADARKDLEKTVARLLAAEAEQKQ